MRDYNIYTDKFHFMSITGLEVTKELNRHGRAYIKGMISGENKEAYMRELMEEQWVKIIAEDENDNREILFCGIVVRGEIEDSDLETGLELELRTGTWLMDIKDHFRVFQKTAYEYEEIISEIGREYSRFDYYINGKTEKIKGLHVQYKETDWQFLKRLAGENGYCVIPGCYTEKSKFELGLYENEIIPIEHTDFVFVRNSKSREYVIKSREIYHLGEKVRFHNQNLYIAAIFTRYERAECVHEYHLLPKMETGIEKSYNSKLAGRSFMAGVTEVRKDKIKAVFPEDENTCQDAETWFCFSTVYSTPDGAGWFCMPELGDRVRIYFPSEEENDAYAVSAVHLDNGTDRQQPEYKSIKNKYGKELLFTPDAMVMTNNKGMKIKIDDEDGILIESDKDIHIIAEGDMMLSSANASVMIAGTENVSINQGETGISIEKKILFNGSEFRIQ